MDMTHKLFEIGALDHLEENTPRMYLKALAEAFGSDARLGDLLLAATEAELETRYQDMEAFEEAAEELTVMIVDAEGLEDGTPEWVQRRAELSLGTYHRIKAERAERESVTV